MMFYDGRWDEGLDCSIDDVLSARLPSRDDPAPLGIAPDRSPKQSPQIQLPDVMAYPTGSAH
jgi:hypothetical protein